MATTLADRTEILRPTGVAPLLTTNQLMAYLGVSNWTLNQWRKAGCPVERLPGGQRRYDLNAVRAWMAERSSDAEQVCAARSRKAVAARVA